MLPRTGGLVTAGVAGAVVVVRVAVVDASALVIGIASALGGTIWDKILVSTDDTTVTSAAGTGESGSELPATTAAKQLSPSSRDPGTVKEALSGPD